MGRRRVLRMKPFVPTEGPLKGKTVSMADTTLVEQLGPQIDRVLEALGYPGALVTDLSTISDFDLDNDDAELARVSRELQVPVERHDSIVDVAGRLARNPREAAH